MRIIIPITGSATASRKRTVTLTTASSPLRHTIVGQPFSPMVSTRTHFGASVAAAHARVELSGNRLAPSADLRGDVLAVCGQHLARVAARREAPVAEPPDLVGESPEQVLFVGDEQGGRAGAAQAVERDCGAFADQRVVAREGVLDAKDRRGH